MDVPGIMEERDVKEPVLVKGRIGSIIFYEQTQPMDSYECFTKWLNKNLPSHHKQSDDIDWIHVRRNVTDKPIVKGDSEFLLKMWTELLNSTKPVYFRSVAELASLCKITSGKWLFYVDSGGKADVLWSKVSEAIVKGTIPSKVAKISSLDDIEDTHSHVICVYNDNFLDKEEVLASERGLRQIGVKCPLLYKPDIYTHLGIYKNNEWGLRPTIYRSEYNIMTKMSTVQFLG